MKQVLFCGMIALALAVGSVANAAEDKPWTFAVSGGVAFLESDIGYGGTAEFLYQMTPSLPIFVGLESGFYMFTDGAFGVSAELKSVPILAVASYRHELNSDMTVYAGTGIGVALDYADVTFGAFSASSDETHFQMVFKPGVEFHKFFFEPRIGFQKDVLLTAMSLGYRF